MGKVILMILIGVELFFLVWQTVKADWNRKGKIVVRAVVAIVILLLLLAGALEGAFRYVPVIIVLGFQILINISILVKKKEKKYSVGKNIFTMIGSIVLYIFCLTLALLFPQSKPIAVTGDHEVATTEYTWEDQSRIETFSEDGENRKVTVKFWYPKEEGEYPLVVFSHGAFGVIDSNYSTCENLASNGYVVASIAHTYQAMYVKDTSGKVTMASQEFLNQIMTMNRADDSAASEKMIYENSQEWMRLRSADENFVLDTILQKVADAKSKTENDIKQQDQQTQTQQGQQAQQDQQLEGSNLWIEINPDKIGLFGHSMGGATSVELGRERDDIDAVIDLEGTMFGEYTGFDDSTGMETYQETSYPIPVLDVNSRNVYDQALKVPGEGYVNFYMGERAANYKSVIVEDAGHLNFTDLPVVSPFLAGMLGTGDVDARECIEHVNDMVLQFFDEYLK